MIASSLNFARWKGLVSAILSGSFRPAGAGSDQSARPFLKEILAGRRAWQVNDRAAAAKPWDFILREQNGGAYSP
jgi:hypothetical protein